MVTLLPRERDGTGTYVRGTSIAKKIKIEIPYFGKTADDVQAGGALTLD